MRRPLRVEISGPAIEHNIRVLREAMGPEVKLCAVVKSNAYGHGIGLVWPIIARHADWLAVASADEAFELRELGYKGPLLMLFCARSCGVGSAAIETLATLIHHRVTLTVTDPGDVELIRTAARMASARAVVHVEIDSGMTRSGVAPDHLLDVLGSLREARDIYLDGLYTHLAAADERGDCSFTEQQLDIFSEVINISGISDNVIIHCANSAAATSLPDARMDMVRVGLMMYGCRPAPHLAPTLDLRPVLRLVAHLMQIHEVPRGTRVGYGLTYTCERPSRIGLVPGGYGDGYLRALSNCGVVRIGEAVAPVVGRVSMDQISIDLTDLPNVAVGDTVELIADDPHAPNSAEQLAAAAETIPYEILTRMDSHRMERLLVDRS